nr:DMT family transporter [uncultured Dethiosulfovibrio sp.]
MIVDEYRGWRASWPMVTATLLWAGAFVAGKMSVGEFPPVTLTFLRFLAAGAIMVPVAVLSRAEWRFPKKDWPAVVFLGLTGMVGYHLFFFEALRHTTAVNSSMIAATSPLVTAFLAAVIGSERLGAKQIGAVVLAVIGVVVIVTDGQVHHLGSVSFNRGDVTMFGAVVSMAVYSVVSRRSGLSRSPVGLVTWTFLVCAVVTGFLSPLEGSVFEIGRAASAGAWWSVAYMAVFASCFGYFLQMFSIRRIGAARTMVFINLIPVFSTILAVMILGESVSAPKVAGLVVVISAVWLNSKVS